MAYAIPVAFVVIVWLAIIFLNERHGLLSCDRFPSPTLKIIAYLWLGLFLLLLAVAVTGAALQPATLEQLDASPFYMLFSLHAILVVFLAGWWALSGAPDLREFLNIRYEKPGEVLAIGTAVGVGGWIFTILTSLVIVLILRGIGLVENPPPPPATVGWMAAMPIWKKALIVLSAMTVEEFFFRSFLQKRVGLIASTILFALAHATYGSPLFLVGVSVISLVIGVTFYRTKNVVPGIIAHGVFDAVQLFVIVPFAFKMMGGA
ncbi:MAG TPA: type II CAAX endopeptidase family protein [Thermoanaerobaculia bacterium]